MIKNLIWAAVALCWDSLSRASANCAACSRALSSSDESYISARLTRSSAAFFSNSSCHEKQPYWQNHIDDFDKLLTNQHPHTHTCVHTHNTHTVKDQTNNSAVDSHSHYTAILKSYAYYAEVHSNTVLTDCKAPSKSSIVCSIRALSASWVSVAICIHRNKVAMHHKILNESEGQMNPFLSGVSPLFYKFFNIQEKTQ